uniref:Uncharacterized protein n=1 Tax=Lygus hesperus TaxID=30085 RepID=A0A146LU84_LYGHE
MMLALKEGPATENVDLTDPLLTGRGLDDDDVFGGAGLGAGKETSHYARRVLSRLPGVTSNNVHAVMDLSGSLAGLATLSLQSLQRVMGNDAGHLLHSFLHNPLAETVE